MSKDIVETDRSKSCSAELKPLFPYSYQHLSYDYGGHMFVPMEFGQTKLFKGDRGKNKEPGLKARLDSLVKTLEFVSIW